MTGFPHLDPNQNYLTDGGAYVDSVSPYGTYDQTGNVWEWNESVINEVDRGRRGGAWNNIPYVAAAWQRSSSVQNSNSPGIGFRLATIPEPSTWVLGVLGLLGLLVWKSRRK